MGGVLGVILAHTGGLDLYAGQIQLLHPGDEVDAHIGGEGVGRPAVDAGAVVQFIENTGDGAGVGGVHVPDVQGGHGLPVGLGLLFVHLAVSGNVKALAHLAQQFLRCGQAIGLFLLGFLLTAAHAEEGFDLVHQTGFLLGATVRGVLL